MFFSSTQKKKVFDSEGKYTDLYGILIHAACSIAVCVCRWLGLLDSHLKYVW